MSLRSATDSSGWSAGRPAVPVLVRSSDDVSGPSFSAKNQWNKLFFSFPGGSFGVGWGGEGEEGWLGV